MNRFIASALGAAALALVLNGNAIAQDKKAAKKAPAVEQKMLVDNDKIQAFEYRYKPGAENTGVPRSARVVRALTNGTLKRTFPDGKTENIEWKAGQVRYIGPVEGATPQYSTKNIGKSDLVLYLVVIK